MHTLACNAVCPQCERAGKLGDGGMGCTFVRTTLAWWRSSVLAWRHCWACIHLTLVGLLNMILGSEGGSAALNGQDDDEGSVGDTGDGYRGPRHPNHQR
jgi:hypothetical protein